MDPKEKHKLAIEENKLRRLIKIEHMRRHLYAMRLDFKERFNDPKLSDRIEIVDDDGTPLPKGSPDELRDEIIKDYIVIQTLPDAMRKIVTKYKKVGVSRERVTGFIKDFIAKSRTTEEIIKR